MTILRPAAISVAAFLLIGSVPAFAGELEESFFDALVGSWGEAESDGRPADGWFDKDCNDALYLDSVDDDALKSPFIKTFGNKVKSSGAMVFYRGADNAMKAIVGDGVDGMTKGIGIVAQVSISDANRAAGSATLKFDNIYFSYTAQFLGKGHLRLIPSEDKKGSGFGPQTDDDYYRCPEE